MKQPEIKALPIQKFGSKLMVAGKSINNIPDFYMQYAQNARIYDGGIGPRKGKSLLLSSTIGTNNKGGFYMGNKLYQITNSKIYEVNLTDGTQTEKATLGYDAPVDYLVYGNIAILVSPDQKMYYFNGTTLTQVATVPIRTIGTATVTIANPAVITCANHGLNPGDIVYLTTTGTLPTGILDGLRYYVISDGFTANSFEISNSIKGTPIATSGTQSGTHTLKQEVNGDMIEYCRGFSFTARNNILYISRPITYDHPEYSYDFQGTGSQNIVFDTKIYALKATMNGIYIFCEDQIHVINSNSLQNVAGSATFISTPLGDSSYPISNFAVAASGDRIFYITKNLKIQTVNYMGANNQQYSADTTIGELSTRPVISINEITNMIDVDQPNMLAYYNENEKNIQFHLRTSGSGLNDMALIYDLTNDTWNIDTNKFYNNIVKVGFDYYGFSDVNSSIYKDGVGYSDGGVPIPFKIITQNLIFGTNLFKLFKGFFTSGGIGFITDIKYNVIIDGKSVFVGTVTGNTGPGEFAGELGGESLGDTELGGYDTYNSALIPFDKVSDGNFHKSGKRVTYEITSDSQIQDFIIDMLGTRLIPTQFTSLTNKF